MKRARLSGRKQIRRRKRKAAAKDGDVRSRDDEGVEGAGGAVLFGPDLRELEGLPDQDGLHHSGVVGVAVVEAVDALQGGLTEVHDGLLEPVATAAG
jgi:hypothetical protein